jgi:FkbM family methyltransferase
MLGDVGTNEPFDDRATEQDVESCYRLLLGRTPDAAGLRHFREAIKSGAIRVTGLADAFLNSAEFKLRQSSRNPSSAYACVKLETFQLCVMADDPMLGKHIGEAGVYERHITDVFRSRVRPGMTVIDVGANVGYYTMLAAAELGGSGRVIAFEPAPQNVGLLHYNAQLNGFENVVEVHPVGLADRNRLMALDMHGSNGMLLDFRDDLNLLGGRTLVRCAMLDQLLNLERLDILKIDVEGTEGLVMKGADAHLRRHRPLVFCEFAPPSLETSSSMSGPDYLSYWVALGYRISIIHRAGSVEALGQDISTTMTRWENEGWSHIDLLLEQP